MTRNRIAFIRKAEVPLAGNHVVRNLKENFPDCEVDLIDLTDLIKGRKDILFINSLFMVKEYGIEILLRKKPMKECFFRTTYLFNKIKAIVSDQIRRGEYRFSFQMQSLFDTSTADIPHFVYTDHTNLANLSYVHFSQKRLYPRFWIELEKTIYQNATLVFTRSSNITNSLIKQYACSPEKIVCVYAGSNSMVAGGNNENKTYTNKNILFVGIDWERKGGPDLVNAFQGVLKAHPDATLTVVGCSPPINLPNVTVAGRVPLADVNRFYRNAAIFCLPTKQEPFGIVFIEALNHSLPIVATNIGAIPDFVIDGENGYLIQPGDVSHLTRHLVELVESPEKCRAFGENGFRLVNKRYNWESVGTLMKENIIAVLNR
jgi:glycosyltransferase involved in cell wall biosynthesis